MNCADERIEACQSSAGREVIACRSPGRVPDVRAGSRLRCAGRNRAASEQKLSPVCGCGQERLGRRWRAGHMQTEERRLPCVYGRVGSRSCFGGFSFFAALCSIQPRVQQKLRKLRRCSSSLRPVVPLTSRCARNPPRKSALFTSSRKGNL